MMMDSYNDNLHKKANPKLYEYARNLRGNETEAETLLWQNLRNRKIAGLKFRRQHPIDKFIADFYCHEKKLVIELDGSIHNNIEQKEADGGRTYELNELGILVIRFSNEEVISDMKSVIKKIIEATMGR
jgi:very-short-patch-repair endonuclease